MCKQPPCTKRIAEKWCIRPDLYITVSSVSVESCISSYLILTSVAESLGSGLASAGSATKERPGKQRDAVLRS